MHKTARLIATACPRLQCDPILIAGIIWCFVGADSHHRLASLMYGIGLWHRVPSTVVRNKQVHGSEAASVIDIAL